MSGSDDTLARLAAVIEARRTGDPSVSYVARLLAKGDDAVLKKIGEEATEVVMACKSSKMRESAISIACSVQQGQQKPQTAIRVSR